MFLHIKRPFCELFTTKRMNHHFIFHWKRRWWYFGLLFSSHRHNLTFVVRFDTEISFYSVPSQSEKGRFYNIFNIKSSMFLSLNIQLYNVGESHKSSKKKISNVIGVAPAWSTCQSGFTAHRGAMPAAQIHWAYWADTGGEQQHFHSDLTDVPHKIQSLYITGP